MTKDINIFIGNKNRIDKYFINKSYIAIKNKKRDIYNKNVFKIYAYGLLILGLMCAKDKILYKIKYCKNKKIKKEFIEIKNFYCDNIKFYRNEQTKLGDVK